MFADVISLRIKGAARVYQMLTHVVAEGEVFIILCLSWAFEL